MLLTDRQALQLIRDMRDNTQSTAVAALCDWALTLAQRQGRRLPRRLLAPRPGADRRRIYMRDLMRRKRAAARANPGRS